MELCNMIENIILLIATVLALYLVYEDWDQNWRLTKGQKRSHEVFFSASKNQFLTHKKYEILRNNKGENLETFSSIINVVDHV